MRAQVHGGMLVLVPSADAPRLVGPTKLLRSKYGVQRNDCGVRYRNLLIRLLTRSPVRGIRDWAAYCRAPDGELQHLHTELAQFADSLAVDGALALDKQFGLLNFGVEIAAPALAMPVVCRALDAKGTQLQAEAADSGGTRHRAAYRLS